jgi:hypothetical protein
MHQNDVIRNGTQLSDYPANRNGDCPTYAFQKDNHPCDTRVEFLSVVQTRVHGQKNVNYKCLRKFERASSHAVWS